MIDELAIRNLGVIAEARLPLGPGFTAVTGETGAGKTMVVSALGLVLGERADSGTVRTGAEQADVDARITLGASAAETNVRERVAELGGFLEDGELYLGRTVSSEGRSKASIGGRSAPVGALAELAEQLVVVHGQSEQLRLRSASAQRNALDRFAGIEAERIREAYRAAFLRWKGLETDLRELSYNREANARELAELSGALEEIEAANPQPGELEALTERAERLGNTEELRLAAANAHESLSSETDAADALVALDSARRALERVRDPELEPLASQLAELSYSVREVAGQLASYLASLDNDGPAELDAVNERRAILNALARKFGGAESSLEGVLAFSADAAERLLRLDSSEERLEQLRVERQAAADEVRSLALELSRARLAAANRLEAAVTKELHALALPDARLAVTIDSIDLGRAGEVLPDGLTESGADTVTLLLAPHPGAEPRPLAKSASGGELSRVMLALEVVMSAADPVPTFVFDEIDAGVGGAAAIEIGRRLARLAEHAQVIVVTHLAQVAAFADNHLRVVKQSDGTVTASSVQQLSGVEREAEMARLLSGLSDSESGLAHARELLGLSR